jgi:hypothetical protein
MGCMEKIKDDEEFWRVMAQRSAMQKQDTQPKGYLIKIDFNKLREICPHRANALCGTLKYYDCSRVNCPFALQEHNAELPTELEMLTEFGWEKLDRDSNQVAHVAHVVYSYIARKLLVGDTSNSDKKTINKDFEKERESDKIVSFKKVEDINDKASERN